MKQLIFFLSFFSILLFAGCEHQKEKKLSSDLVSNPKSAESDDLADLPVIHFEKTTHDFGELMEGERVSYIFKFTNKGKEDLIISDVSTSCGCTVASFPKDPLKPGEEGKLEVVFDSKGERGYQSKSITVLTNSQPNKSILFVQAVVKTQ